MPLARALDYVERIGRIPTARFLSISGGEPFLVPEMLEKIVSAATRQGLHTECVTNCFWAKSEEAALTALGPLRAAGLEVLNLSTDDFHQAHLPFGLVRNAFLAALELDLKPFIMCTVGRSSKLTLERIIDLLGDGSIHVLGGAGPPPPGASALAVQSGFLPVGRGASLPREELMAGESPLGGGCPMVLRDLSISPQGLVRPCCSAGGLVPGMELGRADQEDLEEMVGRAAKREIFAALAEQGPEGLQKSRGRPVEPGRYVNKCHLCLEALQETLGERKKAAKAGRAGASSGPRPRGTTAP